MKIKYLDLNTEGKVKSKYLDTEGKVKSKEKYEERDDVRQAPISGE